MKFQIKKLSAGQYRVRCKNGVLYIENWLVAELPTKGSWKISFVPDDMSKHDEWTDTWQSKRDCVSTAKDFFQSEGMV